MKKYKLLFIAVLFLISCDKTDEEVETVYYEINNVELTDLGQISDKYNFCAYLKNDSTCQVLIRTIGVQKGDSIERIEVYTKGYELGLRINSTLSLWDCSDDTCFTVHDLCFELKGLEAGDYYVSLYVNNGLYEEFVYDIQKKYYCRHN